VFVTSSKYASKTKQNENKKEVPIDVLKFAELVLDRFEKEGAKNIISRNEQFITPNGQEGIKTFGTADFVTNNVLSKGAYIVLGFSTPNLLQQVVLTWKEDDVYADQIMERILGSIELITLTEEQK
jgi:arginine utilization protein RocB